MRILIAGGRVIDPANRRDAVLNLLIEGGRIVEVASPGSHPAPAADRVLDARGKIVCPGFVDLHVHLREPGREDMETIATGTRAAAPQNRRAGLRLQSLCRSFRTPPKAARDCSGS